MRRFTLSFAVVSCLLTLAPAVSARTLEAGTQRPSKRSIVRETESAIQQREAARVRKEARNAGELVTLSDFGVRLRAPKGWTVDRTSGSEGNVTLAVMLLAPDTKDAVGIRHNMNLLFEDLSNASITLNEYTEASLKYEKNFFEGFTLRFQERTTLAGFAADRVQFDAVYNGVSLRYEQVWLIAHDSAAVWTFADSPEGFDEHLPLFRAVLDSFEIGVR